VATEAPAWSPSPPMGPCRQSCRSARAAASGAARLLGRGTARPPPPR
jgi:hypothetical protein